MIGRLLIYLVLALISCPASGQSSKKLQADFNTKGFKPFPDYAKSQDRVHLLSRIIPDSAYAYWEYVLAFDDFDGRNYKRDVIYRNGDRENYAAVARQATANSDYGLFGAECHSPLKCYSYIVGVKDKASVEIIDDYRKLKNFIGSIDTVDEVMLYAIINGYGFDTDTIIGGSYKERKDDYLLHLLEFESMPITYKSVKAVLTKAGEFRVLGKSIYKQTDEYIID